MPKLNEYLTVKDGAQSITGCVIGIDQYRFESFAGTQHTWKSYTMISSVGGLYKRYWITDWKKAGWLLWTACKEIKEPKYKKIIQDRSGVAQIKFSGDAGKSTPVAALVLYEIRKGEYYATERFVGSDVMYFKAKNIPIPKHTKKPISTP